MKTSVRTLQLILPAVALVALTGCDEHDRREVDRGPSRSETREVDDFDSISLRGSAQLQVSIGEPVSLTVEGSEKAIARVETEVDGDTLYIRTSRKEWMFAGGSSRLIVRITLPKLEDLQLEGGNDVRLTGFNGGETTIDIEGAANLKGEGRLDELTVHMSGAGHADLRQLVASDATVTVDGVGSVYVNSTESLDATMNGVGAILYSGTPRDVNTAMRGVGTISKDREGNSRDRDDTDSEVERNPTPPVDPESLQPEYEKEEIKVEA
jgi:hypothetical protein